MRKLIILSFCLCLFLCACSSQTCHQPIFEVKEGQTIIHPAGLGFSKVTTMENGVVEVYYIDSNGKRGWGN